MSDRRSRSAPRSPAQGRSRATVEAILDATVHVLVRDGSDGLTVQSIARRAGVSVGSLYQYFDTKDALVDACARRAMRRSLERLESVLPGLLSLPVGEAASIAVRGLVENWLADEALLRSLLARGGRLEGVDEFQDRAVDLIHAYLEPRAKSTDGAHAGTTAFVLVHAVHAVIEAALRKRPDDLRAERFASELTRLVRSYLDPWEAPGSE